MTEPPVIQVELSDAPDVLTLNHLIGVSNELLDALEFPAAVIVDVLWEDGTSATFPYISGFFDAQQGVISPLLQDNFEQRLQGVYQAAQQSI